MDKRFQWTEFYMELASALLHYKNNRSELIAKLKTIFADAGMNFPFKERGKEVYEDICPFTVFGSFNKGITNANRIALLEQFAKQFSIKAAVPTEFDGIPVVMNLSAWFFAYKENRGEHDIDNLWDLLEKAIAYSDEASTDNKNAFISAYDTVTKQKMIKWNITMGLYWARPYTFINLDSTNRAWYGFNSRVEWCACFVSWCADQCGYIESGLVPKFAGCVDGANWFKSNGKWQDRTYEPKVGDIIFFDWEGDGTTDHVGIVEKCENGTVYTVEGNSGDACKQRQYAVGSSNIYGYGIPAY